MSDPLRPAWNPVPPEEDLRWQIGWALSRFVHPKLADELITLATDTRYGEARSEIVRELPRTKDARVPGVLIFLLKDPCMPIVAAAVEALGKLRYTEAAGVLEGMVDHPDKNVRVAVKKALRRINPPPRT